MSQIGIFKTLIPEVLELSGRVCSGCWLSAHSCLWTPCQPLASSVPSHGSGSCGEQLWDVHGVCSSTAWVWPLCQCPAVIIAAANRSPEEPDGNGVCSTQIRHWLGANDKGYQSSRFRAQIEHNFRLGMSLWELFSTKTKACKIRLLAYKFSVPDSTC